MANFLLTLGRTAHSLFKSPGRQNSLSQQSCTQKIVLKLLFVSDIGEDYMFIAQVIQETEI